MAHYIIRLVVICLVVFSFQQNVIASETKKIFQIPSNEKGILVTTICGKGCKEDASSNVYLLTEEEFNNIKNIDMKSKNIGTAPVSIKNIEFDVYYVGVEVPINSKEVKRKQVGMFFKPAFEDYFINDFSIMEQHVLGSGAPVIIDGRKMYPVEDKYRKWYKIELEKNATYPLVVTFIEKDVSLTQLEKYYPKSINYKLDSSTTYLNNFWDLLQQTLNTTISSNDKKTIIQLLEKGGIAFIQEDSGSMVLKVNPFGELTFHSSEYNLNIGDNILPAFKKPLGEGNNEVRVKNPNDFNVIVGLRSEGKGNNFIVPINGTSSALQIPNGKYDIYFVYSNQPDALYRGDSFTLNDNGIEIQIVKVVDGNYGIERVK